MSDSLHDAFEAWLTAGGRGDLARDVAIHANGCDECAASIAAVDALLLVDIEAAGSSPVRAVADGPVLATPLRRARTAAALGGTVLLGGGVVLGIGMLDTGRTVTQVPATAPAAREGVLGAVAHPSAHSEPRQETGAPAGPDPTPSESRAPAPDPAAPAVPAAQPAPATRRPAPATPRPTQQPTPSTTPAATQGPPASSETPIPNPTPTPTPLPTESPLPSEGPPP